MDYADNSAPWGRDAADTIESVMRRLRGHAVINPDHTQCERTLASTAAMEGIVQSFRASAAGEELDRFWSDVTDSSDVVRRVATLSTKLGFSPLNLLAGYPCAQDDTHITLRFFSEEDPPDHYVHDMQRGLRDWSGCVVINKIGLVVTLTIDFKLNEPL